MTPKGPQLFEQDGMWDRVKGFAKIYVDNIGVNLVVEVS